MNKKKCRESLLSLENSFSMQNGRLLKGETDKVREQFMG